ncbi:dual specificity protein phosphatase 5-like [Sycon ciliatum]|uniref:dual specificity protein phosphatase 5-like n=1 Tax=Sycon ciliatum TaxID=27933 RepID=UPI0031F61A55|eukprot:scpid33780/ scgid29687/ Dual specificity protein phosphatase 5; MAP-kinase phosphatase CPG21
MGLQQSQQTQPVISHQVKHGDELWSTVPVRADKVLPHLFIGNYSSGCNKQFLRQNHVTYVLNMTPEAHTDRLRGIEYLNLGLQDFSTSDISVHFETAHQFLTKAREEGAVALVHCHMGISRAPTVAMSHILLSGKIYNSEEEHRLNAATFKKSNGQIRATTTTVPKTEQVLLKEVWPFVKERRRIAAPNDGFFTHLQSLEMQLTGASSSSTSLEELKKSVYSTNLPAVASLF